MNDCKACGKTVHETAISCPHCGAVEQSAKPAVLTTHGNGPIWISVTGLVFGVFPSISMLAPEAWTREQAMGEAIFAIAALVFGSISLAKHHRGRGMAVAALVLGVIGLLFVVGSQN